MRVGSVIRLVAVTAIVGTSACAGATAGRERRSRSDASEFLTTGRRSDRLGAKDFRVVKGTSAADAVRELRPEFLMPHGKQTALARATVYVDGQYTGEPDVLALISLREVREIQYVGAIAAKSQFGSQCHCDGGVILVRTVR